MILEHALISIEPGREAEFETAFLGGAPEIFAQAEGCHGVELRRCIERPSHFLLLVKWDSVEAHMVGFRESPLFEQWRAIVSGFFASPPSVEHYSAVG